MNQVPFNKPYSTCKETNYIQDGVCSLRHYDNKALLESVFF